MATYTKETALYDTGAIANDIANAGKTATSYITRVDATNGVRVHDLNESTDFVQVNSSAISMYRGGTAAANEKVRIEDDEIRVGATTTGHAILDEDGMDVYIGDESVAHYGDYARIGKDGEANTQISPSEVLISAGNNINALRITPDGNTQTVSSRIVKNTAISKGTTLTVSHPTNADSGSNVTYVVSSKRDGGGNRYYIYITKGQTKTTTTVTTPFSLEYSATATQVKIKNKGTSTIYLFAIYYWQTTTSPLTEVGGVLTVGQYPNVGSNTVLAIGNGTEGALSNVLTATSGGDLCIRRNLYVGCNADGSGGIQLNDVDVSNLLVMQTIGSAVPSQKVARRFGNFIYVSYKIGGVSLSASSTTAILSLFEEVRPANEAIVPANITDSNYATVGTGLIRFETGGWVYLVAPKSLSQTSGLYVMFTALYLI